MGRKKSMFQYILMIIFGVIFLVGFVVFSLNPTPDSQKKIHVGKVVIWGTFDKEFFNKVLGKLREIDDEFGDVEYVEKSKSNFNQEILEGLATGDIPDLILLSNDNFMQNLNKMYKINYNVISDREYKENYLEAFSIYTEKNGFWGIPFMIDPMILFYNKRLFRTNAIVDTPKFWNDLVFPGNQYQKLRVFDNTKENVVLSPIALGEWVNIKHYKEILYTLFLQRGNQLLLNIDNQYMIDSENFDQLTNAIKFYTGFVDSTDKNLYYWNKSKSMDQEEFLASNLGMYIGYTSDIKGLRRKNPNLDFGIAEIPMFRDGKRVAYAKTWVFVLPKQCPKQKFSNGREVCKNRLGAIKTALTLSGEKIQEYIINKLYLPPIRKGMIVESKKQRQVLDSNGNLKTESEFVLNKVVLSDKNKDIFYREAIYANSILDLNPNKTSKIFQEYIDAVNTKLKMPTVATDTVKKELKYLLNNLKLPKIEKKERWVK